VYKFMAKHLGLNLHNVSDADGTINESRSDIEKAVSLLSFTSQNPHPANAIIGATAIDEALRKLQK
jgi:uncharacterized protein